MAAPVHAMRHRILQVQDIHFEDAPQVEVVLLNRPEERFLGVGEGSQGPAAAAIANAIAHATGKRLRALPFTPERVKLALA